MVCVYIRLEIFNLLNLWSEILKIHFFVFEICVLQPKCCRCISCQRHSCTSASSLTRDKYRPDKLLSHKAIKCVACSGIEAERQCSNGVRISYKDGEHHAVIFWKNLGGQREEQLCAYLRTPGWLVLEKILLVDF